MRVYIIGFMGAGKSRYAKNLANHLGYAFIDLDLEIERSEHKWISEIFRTKGEEYFRKTEQNILKKTLTHKDAIIACGGGTPVFFDNMEFMNNHGITIYIKPENKIIIDRLKTNSRKRPLISSLHHDEIEEHVYKLLKERNPYYRKAHYIIDPTNTEIEHIGKLLLR